MFDAPRTIAVLLDNSTTGWRRARHAAALAERWGARVIGVNLVYAGVMVPRAMTYAVGRVAMDSVIAYEKRLDAEAESTSATIAERFQALCSRVGVEAEFRALGRDRPIEDAVATARHSDLVIIGDQNGCDLPETISPERILLAAGVPVLVVPGAWEGKTIGERLVIGWNASPEARHALSESMPFITGAKQVIVLVINPSRDRRHGEEPGSDIALHLARHGARVEVDRVTSSDGSIAEAMVHYVLQHSADLLALGAYSHARWRELLFGGTTQSLLRKTPVPVLISR